MRGFRVCCGCGTGRWIQISAFLSAWLALGAAFANEPSYSTTSERLVAEARQAEMKGDAAEQFARLREAVRAEPDNEQARWQLGEIKIGDEWMAVEDSQRKAAVDPVQVEYRELRRQANDKPAGQLTLARWCRNHGLEDEGRFHWANVLALQPNNREALRALESRWQDGKLVTDEEIDEAKGEAISSRQATRVWSSRVKAWQRVLARERDSNPQTVALTEIRSVRDVAAIPAVEAVTLIADPDASPGSLGRQRMGRAFVTALDEMKEQPATESLVRHAVLAEAPSVRIAATVALGERPLHDFVPILLDGLTMPIESTYRVETSADGSVHYMHSLYREGSEKDWKHETTRAAFARQSNRRVAAQLLNDINRGAMGANVRSAGRGTSTAGSFTAEFSREAAAAEKQVAAMNEAAKALNERIVPVLTSVTGKEFGNKPRAWWDWWTEENGYYQSERPVEETNDSTYAEYAPPELPTQGGRCECFAAGTVVWTKLGQQPIETLNMGDMVLAQDVDTGELAYKPVLGRTIRPPGPLLRFTIGRESLVSTAGHPFWVPGAGWRMAKELEGGAMLHGVTGSTRVEAIRDTNQAPTYNLIVADFNTYFVGESGLLVHDNTPRKPSKSTAPALAEK